jgi:hypothetical protein
LLFAAVAVGLGLLALLGAALALSADGGVETPPPETTVARPAGVPRGDTPAESARLLAEWLRERAG